MTVLHRLRTLLLPLPARTEGTLFQRCLAVHIAGATAPGALS